MRKLELTPIGTLRTPFVDKQSAPRQPAAARGVEARIELVRSGDMEHALSDLEGWSHLWVLFWFDRNTHWKAKVAPPRSSVKRGVFSTRSPYRPNPLGLSVVRLLRVEGCSVHISDVDMLDGTPVLDLKPYVPYADAIPEAQHGWLQQEESPLDPRPHWRVQWSPQAQEQATYLEGHWGVVLVEAVEQVLALGPTPHPYRRIRPIAGGMQLALKAWRLDFVAEDHDIQVRRIRTGYKPKALFDPDSKDNEQLDVHRAFVERFGL